VRVKDTRTLPLAFPEMPGTKRTRCPWLSPLELEALLFEVEQLEALERRAARRRAFCPPVQLSLF